MRQCITAALLLLPLGCYPDSAPRDTFRAPPPAVDRQAPAAPAQAPADPNVRWALTVADGVEIRRLVLDAGDTPDLWFARPQNFGWFPVRNPRRVRLQPPAFLDPDN